MGLGSGIRDPKSGKTLFQMPDPGVEKALDPGFEIRIRCTAFQTRCWEGEGKGYHAVMVEGLI
jgi:hypothetical protein